MDRLIQIKAHLTTLHNTYKQKELMEAMQPPRFLAMLNDTQVG